MDAGVPVPMKILLAPIELLEQLLAVFINDSFVRENINTGHVVLMSILGLIFIFKNLLGGTLSFGLGCFIFISLVC